MSLLMEALRKAEEAKRKGQEQAATDAREASPPPQPASTQATPPEPAFTLEEREPEVTPQYILDNFIDEQETPEPESATADLAPPPADDPEAELPLHEAELEFDDTTNNPTPAAQAPRRQRVAGQAPAADQLAAASVFNAKRVPAKGNRATYLVLGSLLALLLAGGGGFFWYQMSADSGIGVNPALANMDLSNRSLSSEPLATPPVDATPAQAPAEAQPQAIATLEDEPVESPGQAEEENGLAALQAPTPAPEQAPAPTEQVAAVPQAQQPVPTPPPLPTAITPTPQDSQQAASADVPTLPAATDRPTLQISRSSNTRQPDQRLLTAYRQLQSGDLQNAAQLYQELLAELPNNRDALLGLAQARMRQQQAGAARELYARLLQLNPRDPLARTGLLQTMQGPDPLAYENELKTLLAQYPDLPPLSFALGNFYASQRRWSEAQSAYFNALLNARRSGDPVHPDYAFNLAVSLEQLNQRGAALDYYRQARELALEITPGFDLQLLNSRLATLEQNQP